MDCFVEMDDGGLNKVKVIMASSWCLLLDAVGVIN